MKQPKHNVTNVDSIDRRYIKESQREIPPEIKDRCDGLPMMEDLTTLLIRYSGRTRLPDTESSHIARDNFPYLRSFENEVRDRLIHNTHGHKVNSVLAARAMARQLLEIKDKRLEEGRKPVIMVEPKPPQNQEKDSGDNDDEKNEQDSDETQDGDDSNDSTDDGQGKDSGDKSGKQGQKGSGGNDDEDRDEWNEEDDEGAIDPGNEGGSGTGDDEPEEEDFGDDGDDDDFGEDGDEDGDDGEDGNSGEDGGGDTKSGNRGGQKQQSKGGDSGDSESSDDSGENGEEGSDSANSGDSKTGGNSDEDPQGENSGKISEQNNDYDPNGFDDFFDMDEIGEIMKSMEDAKEEIGNLENISRAFSDLFGSGNIENYLSLSDILQLANKYSYLKRVATYMGHFRKSTKKRRSTKGISDKNGAVVGVCFGDDLDRVHEIELTNKTTFALGYATRTLQQDKMRAKDPRDNGDFIVVIDESGSMEGQRNEVAKAYAMNVLAEAAKKGKNCVLIRFGSDFIVEEYNKSEKRSDKIRKILKFGMDFMYSGTSFEGWIKHIMHGIKNSKRMDVLILSDGSTTLQKTVADEYRKWSKKNDVSTELILIHVSEEHEKECAKNSYYVNDVQEWGLTGIATNVFYIEPGEQDLEKAMNKHLKKL